MEMLHGSDGDDSMILFLKEMLFKKKKNRTTWFNACKYLQRGENENSELWCNLLKKCKERQGRGRQLFGG